MTEAHSGITQLPANASDTRAEQKAQSRLSPEPSREQGPADTFTLLASRTMGESISVVFSHLVCGNLLWQPRK